MSVLNTGIKVVKNVSSFIVGQGSIYELPTWLCEKKTKGGRSIIFVDREVAKLGLLPEVLVSDPYFRIEIVDAISEPTTEDINKWVDYFSAQLKLKIDSVAGVGGGVTMDTAKAVSNMLSNPGRAEDYQGWDLVMSPGVFKIGVPTISGTGAEATRTCVMTNKASGLKLGMNSDYTVFDRVILDPSLTQTVPPNQYFWTGMDAYIHCIEALSGSYRNPVGDAFSRETISLCREVFGSDDMQSLESREKMMVASYLGGCSIATSYVGLVHPLSAALSVVFGVHHCVGNCIVMRAMEDFYPEAYSEFWGWVDKHGIEIPQGICTDLNDEVFTELFDATVIHEKPLTNALGDEYLRILTPRVVRSLFEMM